MNNTKNKVAATIMAQIQKNVDKKTWPCMFAECTENAINSHLLQRHGVLDVIIENGHLYEIKRSDYFKWNQIAPIEFKRVGINQAISLPLFCNKHDSELFYSIEHGPLECSDYKTQLLFSYRAICAEIRKKEVNIEITTRNKNSRNLQFPIDIAEMQIKGYKLGIKDLLVYSNHIKEELISPSNAFKFISYKYPALGVYASATFSFDEDNTPIRLFDSNIDKTWNSGFIHIIPQADCVNIIIGYHESYTNKFLQDYAMSWQNLNNVELGTKLTDLFAARIETWGLSPSIYSKISPLTKKKYIDYMTRNAMNYNISQHVDFNLFIDILKD